MTLGPVHRQQLGDRVAERLGPGRSDPLEAGAADLVAVDVVADEEGDAGAGEQVVHHGVPHVALEPVPGLVPDLADDVRVGVAGADPAAELAPEVVVLDLAGHVQPPAVDAEVDPAPGDPEEELAHRGRLDVELRQGRQAPPGVIARGLLGVVGVQREARDVEPVEVGRVLAVLEDVVELEEPPAGVVEHAVEHHPHAPRVAGVQELAQCGVAAEHRVDLLVVVRVVAVVAGGLEDRREVDRVDAEVLQIVELLDHADEVAALVAVRRRRVAPGVQARGLGDGQAAGEAVGEDLVEDGVADPVGRRHFGQVSLRGRGEGCVRMSGAFDPQEPRRAGPVIPR